MSKTHTVKWVWNEPYPAVERHSLLLTIIATSGHFLSFWCYLVYIILYPRCRAFNKKIKYGWSNLTNTVINVRDITWQGYKYRHKKRSQSSHQVNNKKNRHFDIHVVLSGLTNWMDCIIHVWFGQSKVDILVQAVSQFR